MVPEISILAFHGIIKAYWEWARIENENIKVCPYLLSLAMFLWFFRQL
ncbi:MAG: hypothetical protein ILNGONEN_00638 [Syntrophorhabdaceae bacterium]|jgi:hypothetical protein|nr:hypothetical protein [Syntrophorhabdaceae bacterium]